MKHTLLLIVALLIVTACAPQQKEAISSSINDTSSEQGKVLAACIFMAAETYDVPPGVLTGIYKVEGGEVGKEYGPLPDGSYDLGPMRINTSNLPALAQQWEVDEEQAKEWVQNDPCTNMGVTAWLLRTRLDETKGDQAKAIALYNAGLEDENLAFKEKVMATMEQYNLIEPAGGK